MRQAFFLLSFLLVGMGLYLRFFYDVPDSQETVNFFTGWFLVILGTAGLFMTAFWSAPRDPKGKP